MKFESKKVAATTDAYKSLLKIDKNNLDEEVIQHSVHFHEVNEHLERIISLHDEAKAKAEERFNSLYLTIKAGEGKVTVKDAEAQVAQDSEYKKLKQAQVDLAEQVGQWTALSKSWSTRSKMLDLLCSLYSSGYWAKTGQKGIAGEAAVRRVREANR